jgi:hypothetical protein
VIRSLAPVAKAAGAIFMLARESLHEREPDRLTESMFLADNLFSPALLDRIASNALTT